MSSNSKIEWTDHTWNPVTGCTKVSLGCRNCYAERMANRVRGRFGYPKEDSFQVVVRPHRLEDPFHWRKPRRIFVGSMGDMFHEDVSFDFLAAIFGAMAANPQHLFQVLTKRHRRMLDFLTMLEAVKDGPSLEAAYQLLWNEARHHPEACGGPIHCWYGPAPEAPWPLSNVWLGVTAETHEMYHKRTEALLECSAAVRYLSMEPLLEPMTALDLAGIDWVIVGGETGPRARPMDPDWARSIRDQCQRAKVPFFMKKLAGGKEPPEDLMIREFPRE